MQAILPSDVILDNNYSGKVYLQAIDKAGKVLPAKLSPTSVNMKVDVELPHKDVPIVGKITGKKMIVSQVITSNCLKIQQLLQVSKNSSMKSPASPLILMWPTLQKRQQSKSRYHKIM